MRDSLSVPVSIVPARWAERHAFALYASLPVTFLAGSSLPTPLYPLYQSSWGISPISVTIVFAIYAIAVLAALLTAGRLADHVGRRPVLLTAVAAQIAAMAVMAGANGIGALLAGRVIQGLATGAAVGTIGAALLELHRARGAIANAIAPIMGTAAGALAAGLMVHFLPAPLHLAYAVLAVVLMLQGVALLGIPEALTPRAGAWASLRPVIKVPHSARAAMMAAVPVLVASWATAGLYGSLGPALVKRIFLMDPSLYGGLTMFTLATSGALAVLGMRNAATRTLMRTGTFLMAAGTAVTLLSICTGSFALYCAATLVVGAGFGTGFQGAIRIVIAPVALHERAAVLSVLYVVSYLSMGLPAVLAGAAIVAGATLLATALTFGAVVIALAVFALLADKALEG